VCDLPVIDWTGRDATRLDLTCERRQVPADCGGNVLLGNAKGGPIPTASIARLTPSRVCPMAWHAWWLVLASPEPQGLAGAFFWLGGPPIADGAPATSSPCDGPPLCVAGPPGGGRQGLLQFVRYFCHALEPKSRRRAFRLTRYIIQIFCLREINAKGPLFNRWHFRLFFGRTGNALARSRVERNRGRPQAAVRAGLGA
jgi:hypothetical protein